MRSGEKARTGARCPRGRAGRGRRPAVALRAACRRAGGAGLRHRPCRGRSAPSVTVCVSLQEPRASKCPLGFFGDNIINNASAEALTTVPSTHPAAPSPRGQRALDSGARGAAGPHASLRPSEGAVQAAAPRPARPSAGVAPAGTARSSRVCGPPRVTLPSGRRAAARMQRLRGVFVLRAKPRLVAVTSALTPLKMSPVTRRF